MTDNLKSALKIIGSLVGLVAVVILLGYLAISFTFKKMESTMGTAFENSNGMHPCSMHDIGMVRNINDVGEVCQNPSKIISDISEIQDAVAERSFREEPNSSDVEVGYSDKSEQGYLVQLDENNQLERVSLPDIEYQAWIYDGGMMLIVYVDESGSIKHLFRERSYFSEMNK
ncbi:MAG: hypothetical protein ABII02_03995 [Candidatus Magasanikbacteria bacterium]